MLIKIFGCLYIVMAVLLLLNPEAYQRWIKKNKEKRLLLLPLPLIFGIIFIYIGLMYEGVLATIIVVFGALAILKAAIFLIPSLYNSMIDWALDMPLVLYRVGACVHIAIGAIFLFL